MRQVFLCLGENAQNPYYFDRAHVRVGTVEELCYFFRENIYLLDSSMCTKELADWIGKECGLPELSDRLKMALKDKSPVSAFVDALFSFTGYCTPAQIHESLRILKETADISRTERQKSRADYFLKTRRYVLAAQEYTLLLDEMYGAKQEAVGEVYHNLGVAQARMFLFEKAADSFKKAWQLTGREESRLQYLAAMRMQLPEKEYVAFLASAPEFYEDSLKLEQMVEERKQEWTKSSTYKVASEALEVNKEGVYGMTDELLWKKIEPLQAEYRNYVVQ